MFVIWKILYAHPVYRCGQFGGDVATYIIRSAMTNIMSSTVTIGLKKKDTVVTVLSIACTS